MTGPFTRVGEHDTHADAGGEGVRLVEPDRCEATSVRRPGDGCPSAVAGSPGSNAGRTMPTRPVGASGVDGPCEEECGIVGVGGDVASESCLQNRPDARRRGPRPGRAGRGTADCRRRRATNGPRRRPPSRSTQRIDVRELDPGPTRARAREPTTAPPARPRRAKDRSMSYPTRRCERIGRLDATATRRSSAAMRNTPPPHDGSITGPHAASTTRSTICVASHGGVKWAPRPERTSVCSEASKAVPSAIHGSRSGSRARPVRLAGSSFDRHAGTVRRGSRRDDERGLDHHATVPDPGVCRGSLRLSWSAVMWRVASTADRRMHGSRRVMCGAMEGIFGDIFEAVAAAVPDRPVQVFGDQTHSWRDLDRRANALACRSPRRRTLRAVEGRGLPLQPPRLPRDLLRLVQGRAGAVQHQLPLRAPTRSPTCSTTPTPRRWSSTPRSHR